MPWGDGGNRRVPALVLFSYEGGWLVCRWIASYNDTPIYAKLGGPFTTPAAAVAFMDSSAARGE